MNSKTALCQALINGEVINIRNIHQKTGFTNASREVGRNIERIEDGGFGVIVSRTNRNGKNRFGVHCKWTDYRLNKTEYNKNGIRAIKNYIKQQTKTK